MVEEGILNADELLSTIYREFPDVYIRSNGWIAGELIVMCEETHSIIYEGYSLAECLVGILAGLRAQRNA